MLHQAGLVPATKRCTPGCRSIPRLRFVSLLVLRHTESGRGATGPRGIHAYDARSPRNSILSHSPGALIAGLPA